MRQLKFDRNEDGNIAVISALAMTALMGVTGLALLYNQANWARTELQASLDTAVIAGTTLPDGTPDKQRIAAAAISFKTNLQSSGLADSADFKITVAPKFLVNMTHVSGMTTGTVTNSLGVAMGISKMALETTAEAEKIKSDPLCVLALNSTQPASIEVYGNAQFHARDCAVQANSANSAGMKLYGNASASASEFGVTGGYSGQAWSPEPVVGVGKVTDPYASLPVPAAGSCEPVSKSIKTDMTLAPGTYCGGIDVKTGANVT